MEMVRPTVYGQIVIFLVFVPCLSFQGVEGKMFSPMVITLMLALASAFLLSLTFVPAMAAILVRGKVAEREVPIIRAAKRVYAPILRRALARPLAVIACGIAVFVTAVMVFLSLGRVFMPVLDEISVDLAAVRIYINCDGDSSKDLDFKVERALLALSEVELVFSKAGTANWSFDAMPSNASDNYVMLKPRDQAAARRAQRGGRAETHPGDHRTHRRQFLRDDPADPDAVQRTHQRRAQRGDGRDLRRRSRDRWM